MELPERLRGRLLVASPHLLDPNFARAVVFMLDHDDGGAVGVVLNRPSETPLDEALEVAGWQGVASEPPVAFVGGPVQPQAAICLARVGGASPPGFQTVVEGVGTLALDADDVAARDTVENLRVFAGYAGWGPGQLEEELRSDDWFVFDALPGDVFDRDPDGLWQRVLARQGGNLRMVAHFPLHPSFN